jgi:predicted porin
MRKTQFALAALALVASTAALADGVTVYGTADISVVRTDVGTSMAGAGNSAGSIFGVRASEDLGGGLKASANLETGYTGTNGQLANGGDAGGSTVIFNRAANVGISNENLGLTLGTNLSPFILGELTGATGVGGAGVFVPGLLILNGGNLAGTSTSSGGFFVSNAVTLSASFNGVNASVMGATRSVTDPTNKYTAMQVGTSVGGLNVNLAYQDMTNLGIKTNNTVLSANMSFGDLRINGAFSANKNADVSNNGYLLGASMPLVGALSGGLTYASNKDSGLANMTSVSLQYTLSKSTFAYVNHNQFSKNIWLMGNDQGSQPYTGANAGGDSMTMVGLAHSF